MLSEVTPSTIGSWTNTVGTGDAEQVVRVFWDEYLFTPIQRSVTATLSGAVVQEYDFEGRGQTVTLRIPHCPYPTFAGLKDAGGHATFVTKELDGDGEEVTRELFGLKQLSLNAESSRIGTNLDYRNVVAVFVTTKAEGDT